MDASYASRPTLDASPPTTTDANGMGKVKSSSGNGRKPKQWRSGFVNPLDANGKKRKGRPPRAAYHAAGMLDSYDHRNVQCTDLAKQARVFIESPASSSRHHHRRTASSTSFASTSTSDSPRSSLHRRPVRRLGGGGAAAVATGESDDGSSPSDESSLSSWDSPPRHNHLATPDPIPPISSLVILGDGQHVNAAGSVPKEAMPAIALPKLHPDLFRFPPLSLPNPTTPPTVTAPATTTTTAGTRKLTLDASPPIDDLAPVDFTNPSMVDCAGFSIDDAFAALGSIPVHSSSSFSTGMTTTTGMGMPGTDGMGMVVGPDSLLTPTVSRFLADVDLPPSQFLVGPSFGSGEMGASGLLGFGAEGHVGWEGFGAL